MAEKKKSRLKKLVLVGGVGFVGLLALGYGGLYVAAQAQLNRDVTAPEGDLALRDGDKDAIARGEYLVKHVMGCGHNDCHRADFGGGPVMDQQPIGRVYAPNITAGEGSVTKDYTGKDWARILRHGVKKNGKRALVMPSEDYVTFSDSDLAAAIAYIKAQPPVNRESLAHSLGPIGLLIAATEPVYAFDKIDHNHKPAEVKRGANKEWGQVMAGTCKGCHGEGYSGGKVPGGDPSWPAARNISPDEATGIGKWTFDQFEAAVRKGQRPDGSTLHDAMPWKMYQGMDDVDLKALWEYLRTVPAKPAGGR
ncbi:MAG: c-type cytochrome [Planctomycetes bacterium]|jgi:mono/diheme cytochrome c family protein|nr:c-type cytochrome [Planctomycetota bacterium]MCL4732076.1 c-type cytochrome [Planctomycetota bacterium]